MASFELTFLIYQLMMKGKLGRRGREEISVKCETLPKTCLEKGHLKRSSQKKSQQKWLTESTCSHTIALVTFSFITILANIVIYIPISSSLMHVFGNKILKSTYVALTWMSICTCIMSFCWLFFCRSHVM